MLSRVRQLARKIESFLEEFYARSPGCCASGGLSTAQLNGERDADREPAFPTDDWEFQDYRVRQNRKARRQVGADRTVKPVD
jgi:hypothetical protein